MGAVEPTERPARSRRERPPRRGRGDGDDAGPGVTLDAPAKLTVSLRIVGVRADGYHLLDAEMVSVSLCDTLRFSAGNRLVMDGLAVPGPVGDNLVIKALRAVNRETMVHLEKRIPPGAGLGGGSADAAAVLRWAECDDLEVAAGLGADVPFCVVGGRARVTGVGEVVDPLPFVEQTYTLVTPPFGVSTVAVYRQWDAMGGPAGESGNDLERAAVAIEPRLAPARDALGDATGLRPRLAGSGSTWFVEGAFPDAGLVVHTLPPH